MNGTKRGKGMTRDVTRDVI